MSVLERFTSEYSRAFELSSRAVFIQNTSISVKNKFIYCATPKVACSTILQTLQRFQLQDRAFLHDPSWEIHNRAYSPLISPLQVPSFKALAARPDIFKFCFVRNPYDRLVSCYLDKVKSGGLTDYYLGLLNRTGGAVEFEEFIEVITAQPTEQMEAHSGVQYLQTLQGHIDYDFIGRFEELQLGLEHVAARIGMNLALYQARVDPHRTGEKPFRDYLSAKVVQKITDCYALDFDRFGYSPIPPL